MTTTTKSPLQFGAWLWVASIQYYVVQVVAALAWHPGNGYSLAKNTISDLGNTQAGWYGGKLVVSPLHTLMNASFIVLGCTMIVGSYLLAKQLATHWLIRVGFGCMILAGLGSALVGIFPENTISSGHIAGASLAFFFGNIGMVILGARLSQLPVWLRGFTVLSGVVGLSALVLFLTHVYLGLDIGGMERFVGYPQSIWMIVFGLYILNKNYYRTILARSVQ